MKTRVINKQNAGNYTDEFIEQNKDKVINGVLVSEWDLAKEYKGDFLNPIYENNEWIEGATPEQIAEQQQQKEFAQYQIRLNRGVESYLNLCAEFRLLKEAGTLTPEHYAEIEENLIPVRDELVNGQFITAKSKLEAIGFDVIGEQLYNRFIESLTKDIEELY